MRWLLAFALCCWAGSFAAADEKVKMSDEGKAATKKAFEWLVAKQESDGSWGDSRYPHNTAVTGFVLLAFLSQGHTPNHGPYGEAVAKGVRFLLASSRDKDGYLIGARGGNMYCHGMATLALGEVWGMTGDEEVRNTFKRAIDLIIRSQSPQGGWRYEPHPHDADLSVTIMQVMALRSAKNGGLHVPDRTFEKAIEYIEKCYEPNTGGFRYQPGSRGPGFARTAAGCAVLQLTGKYDAAQIPKAIEFMKKTADTREHFWYGHYYAIHAMHQVGGKEWAEWYERMSTKLIKLQGPAGDFSEPRDGHGAGPVYQTSIAVIMLSVPANLLPIYQR
jgi:hypothetical protein